MRTKFLSVRGYIHGMEEIFCYFAIKLFHTEDIACFRREEKQETVDTRISGKIRHWFTIRIRLENQETYLSAIPIVFISNDR